MAMKNTTKLLMGVTLFTSGVALASPPTADQTGGYTGKGTVTYYHVGFSTPVTIKGLISIVVVPGTGEVILTVPVPSGRPAEMVYSSVGQFSSTNACVPYYKPQVPQGSIVGATLLTFKGAGSKAVYGIHGTIVDRAKQNRVIISAKSLKKVNLEE